jgi:large subunit ribosomal protein L5
MAHNSHIILKIRKGNLIGCKVILTKILMYNFFTKLLVNLFSQMKEFKEFSFQKKTIQKNSYSLQLKNTFIFLELEQNYNLFNNLSNLNITIVTNTSTQNELLFLLNSFKLVITKQLQT